MPEFKTSSGRYSSGRDQLGSMRERIEIYKPVMTKDENNEQVLGSPVLIGKRWASVDFGSGKEDEEGGRLSMITMVTFRIRFDQKFWQPTYYIKWRDQLYDIRSIEDPAGDRNFLVFKTETRQLTS